VVKRACLKSRKGSRLRISTVLCIAAVGCSGGPPALRPPSLDPESAAEQAIELYDKDEDGVLSLSELKACPGMLAFLEIYDRDNDQMISPEEIVRRLQEFIDSRSALCKLSATVRLNRRPLGGATVRFIPEPYLGGEIRPATGKTRRGGSATMAIADEELPENQKGIRGIHTATYRVEITHPEIRLPAKFNTETVLLMAARRKSLADSAASYEYRTPVGRPGFISGAGINRVRNDPWQPLRFL